MADKKQEPLVIKRTEEEEAKMQATVKKMRAVEKLAKNFKVPWTFGTDSAGELFVLFLRRPEDAPRANELVDDPNDAGMDVSNSGKRDK